MDDEKTLTVAHIDQGDNTLRIMQVPVHIPPTFKTKQDYIKLFMQVADSEKTIDKYRERKYFEANFNFDMA